MFLLNISSIIKLPAPGPTSVQNSATDCAPNIPRTAVICYRVRKVVKHCSQVNFVGCGAATTAADTAPSSVQVALREGKGTLRDGSSNKHHFMMKNDTKVKLFVEKTYPSIYGNR